VVTLPGRLTRYKNHAALLSLMIRLKQRAPDVRALIVGGEDPRRRAYAASIRRQIDEAGLHNVVLTGHRSDIREVYAVSNVVLSLSSNPPEAFGRAALEALSLGIPVVGFDHSGVGEVLGQMLPQGAVKAGDLDALTERVLAFLDSPPPVCTNVRYTRAAMLEQTLDVYHRLAA
jgi:glycosyltransferase involved in cell wall biosynthesis